MGDNRWIGRPGNIWEYKGDIPQEVNCEMCNILLPGRPISTCWNCRGTSKMPVPFSEVI